MEDEEEEQDVTQHKSYQQVMLDVSRCAGRFGPLDQTELREKLASLIVKLLIAKPKLHYYQGFHDVCLTYMTLLGPEEAFSKLNSLVDTHFQLFMQPTMDETQEFLALIPILAGLHNYQIQDLLERAEVGTIFALSWVITWFSHVITDERDVEQIFLFLEDQDPQMVLHLCVAILVHKKDSILELEPDMSTVHHFLSQIPRKEKLPIKKLIKDAKLSFERWPPEKLKKRLDDHRRSLQRSNLFRGIVSRFSITKTSVIVFVLASVIAMQYDRWYR